MIPTHLRAGSRHPNGRSSAVIPKQRNSSCIFLAVPPCFATELEEDRLEDTPNGGSVLSGLLSGYLKFNHSASDTQKKEQQGTFKASFFPNVTQSEAFTGKDYEPEVCVPKICCMWTVMPSRVLLKLVELCVGAHTSHTARRKAEDPEPRSCAVYKD